MAHLERAQHRVGRRGDARELRRDPPHPRTPLGRLGAGAAQAGRCGAAPRRRPALCGPRVGERDGRFAPAAPRLARAARRRVGRSGRRCPRRRRGALDGRCAARHRGRAGDRGGAARARDGLECRGTAAHAAAAPAAAREGHPQLVAGARDQQHQHDRGCRGRQQCAPRAEPRRAAPPRRERDQERRARHRHRDALQTQGTLPQTNPSTSRRCSTAPSPRCADRDGGLGQ